MATTRQHGLAAVLCSVLLVCGATGAHAQRVEPPPMTSAEPGVTVGPPVVTESQPSLSPPLSQIENPAAISIRLDSGQVSKTVSGGQAIAMPLNQGSIEVVVQFPHPVDGRAASVTLQQTAGGGVWEVLSGVPLSPNQVVFELNGSDVADLLIDVRPPGGGGVRFGLSITPSTVISVADGGGTVQLKQGDQFSLDLTEGYAWTVSVADENIVGAAQGGQGTYEARQPGSTQLLVSGDPACLRSRVGCLMPSRVFQITILVV